MRRPNNLAVDLGIASGWQTGAGSQAEAPEGTQVVLQRNVGLLQSTVRWITRGVPSRPREDDGRLWDGEAATAARETVRTVRDPDTACMAGCQGKPRRSGRGTGTEDGAVDWAGRGAGNQGSQVRSGWLLRQGAVRFVWRWVG